MKLSVALLAVSFSQNQVFRFQFEFVDGMQGPRHFFAGVSENSL